MGICIGCRIFEIPTSPYFFLIRWARRALYSPRTLEGDTNTLRGNTKHTTLPKMGPRGGAQKARAGIPKFQVGGRDSAILTPRAVPWGPGEIPRGGGDQGFPGYLGIADGRYSLYTLKREIRNIGKSRRRSISAINLKTANPGRPGIGATDFASVTRCRDSDSPCGGLIKSEILGIRWISYDLRWEIRRAKYIKNTRGIDPIIYDGKTK